MDQLPKKKKRLVLLPPPRPLASSSDNLPLVMQQRQTSAPQLINIAPSAPAEGGMAHALLAPLARQENRDDDDEVTYLDTRAPQDLPFFEKRLIFWYQLVNTPLSFVKYLQNLRCRAPNCAKHTSLFPFCMEHLRSEKGLEVRHTPQYGWGLFAVRDIPKDTNLGCYTGELVSETEERTRYGVSHEISWPYSMIVIVENENYQSDDELMANVPVFGDSRGDRALFKKMRRLRREGQRIMYIDSASHRCYLSLMNQIGSNERHNRGQCQFEKIDEAPQNFYGKNAYVEVVCKRKIKCNEQIFVDYGETYLMHGKNNFGTDTVQDFHTKFPHNTTPIQSA